MKGVILAGGKGLRLYPLTKVTNKHLLPVGTEPMILNPIRKLVEAGVTDILIITSTEHMGDIVNLLGSGIEYGANFTYKVQESAGGIAHALALAENFANKQKITVILGDNITTGSITPYVQAFRDQKEGARVLLKKVEDPSRYGVATIDGHKVLDIEEKPKNPKSDFAVIGYYMYDGNVFDVIRNMKPSARGEYEITDVNNAYLKKGQLTCDVLDADWTDAGTFASLALANDMILRNNSADHLKSLKVSREQLGDMIDHEKRKLKDLQKHLEGLSHE